MNKDLNFYIRVDKGVIDKKICNQTIKELKKDKDFKKHLFHDNIKNTYTTRVKKELSISVTEPSTFKSIMASLHGSIGDYVEYINSKNFSTWSGYSGVRFNRYNKGEWMAPHCDHIQDLFDGDIKGIPILSIVGLLNDDFTGGEFMFFNEKIIDLKQGDVLIFPSNFLYPHGVQPVTKGCRYSFVSWVY